MVAYLPRYFEQFAGVFGVSLRHSSIVVVLIFLLGYGRRAKCSSPVRGPYNLPKVAKKNEITYIFLSEIIFTPRVTYPSPVATNYRLSACK